MVWLYPHNHLEVMNLQIENTIFCCRLHKLESRHEVVIDIFWEDPDFSKSLILVSIDFRSFLDQKKKTEITNVRLIIAMRHVWQYNGSRKHSKHERDFKFAGKIQSKIATVKVAYLIIAETNRMALVLHPAFSLASVEHT